MVKMTYSFGELSEELRLSAGGKGGSLTRLYQAGFPVPTGFVILPTGFSGDDLREEAWQEAMTQLTRLRASDDDVAFAVRSSALSEDSVDASFAGEFETVLNVYSNEEIREAITTVYRSRQSERVQAYSKAKDIDVVHEVAVIVQQLVDADRSGILFTANPVTGNRDQALINAVWGLGEAVVGGLVTPDTLTIGKETARVLSRETADKRVMTVRLDSGTEEQPVPSRKRRARVLSDSEAAELVRIGVEIEKLFGMPMDIEWVLAEDEFSIVQARPITALSEPIPIAPTKWNFKGIAMRNNIVELMADPMTPLFGTLGLTVINVCMNRVMDQFFGKPGLMPEGPIVSVNDYAFYNGSMKPGQIAQILLGSVGIMKRMLSKPVERWIEVGRPNYISIIERWKSTPWRDFDSSEILEGARELFEAAIDAYVALVSGVIPVAWMSEALFTFVYRLLIQRRDDPLAPIYLMGFDSVPIRAEKSLYDLAAWVQTCEKLVKYLNNTHTQQLVVQMNNGKAPLGVNAVDWCEWVDRLQAHLQQFGHTIYNLDFANPVPRDDPAPLLETCKMFINGQGANPHTRQLTASEKRERATEATLKRLRGWRLKLFRKLLTPAQRFAPLREDGLADIGLGYPLLRQMLLEVGNRFVAAGMINNPSDIFWLVQDEVEQAASRLTHGESLSSSSDIVSRRKASWHAMKTITPPRMLPEFKFLGWMKTARSRSRDKDILKGVAASPGLVTAPACVLSGLEDFTRMKVGDVLVASITTPAWTPLFARAAAIVTDVGGPLSHGSIVAREYGIPAVLGTGDATYRIHDGQVITVDGSAGKVSLSMDNEAASR